jgi:hypothetical protein
MTTVVLACGSSTSAWPDKRATALQSIRIEMSALRDRHPHGVLLILGGTVSEDGRAEAWGYTVFDKDRMQTIRYRATSGWVGYADAGAVESAGPRTSELPPIADIATRSVYPPIDSDAIVQTALIHAREQLGDRPLGIAVRLASGLPTSLGWHRADESPTLKWTVSFSDPPVPRAALPPQLLSVTVDPSDGRVIELGRTKAP